MSISGSDDKPPIAGGEPFWRVKKLGEMSHAEWESLCDGCARCCLVKLEDEDDASIHYTDLGCRLLDAGTCRCSDYKARSARVPDCVTLTPDEVGSLGWLPPTCAYRLIADGQGLPWWHPLVSGDPATVHQAGISVKDKVFASEDDLPVTDWPARIKRWPTAWAKGRG